MQSAGMDRRTGKHGFKSDELEHYNRSQCASLSLALLMVARIGRVKRQFSLWTVHFLDSRVRAYSALCLLRLLPCQSPCSARVLFTAHSLFCSSFLCRPLLLAVPTPLTWFSCVGRFAGLGYGHMGKQSN